MTMDCRYGFSDAGLLNRNTDAPAGRPYFLMDPIFPSPGAFLLINVDTAAGF
jgi:hypothetical protein